MAQNCGNCRYMQEEYLHETRVISMYCRRYPPHPRDWFPIVGFDHWCGEWASDAKPDDETDKA